LIAVVRLLVMAGVHSATFGNTPADNPGIFDFYEHAILLA